MTLKGFKLQRIQLTISPQLIVAYPQGYLISDRQGNLTLIDGRDLSLKQFRLSLSKESRVTAISLTNRQLLVATTTSSQSQLHQFSLPSL